MKSLTKLGIAVVLGVLAGILNSVYLSQSTSFVKVNAEIKRGEPIKPEHLTALNVADEQGALKKSFIPWEDRNQLLRLRTNRDYKPGDVLLRRDVEEMQFQTSRKTETLKFRVIAVGDKFKRQQNSDSVSSASGTGTTVTIAVKQPTLPNGEYDVTTEAGRAAKRMVRVVTRQMTGKEPIPEDTILGVAVFPRVVPPEEVKPGAPKTDASKTETPTSPEKTTETTTPMPPVKPKPPAGFNLPLVGGPPGKVDPENATPIELPAKDEMALTIPLDGVESVPAVILVGGEIGFFMYPEFPH